MENSENLGAEPHGASPISSSQTGPGAFKMNRPPAVVVDGLTKKFNGFTAVDNLSLAVPQGEFFGFLGPNGAGKSTTIKVLVGILKADYRKISIAGNDLRRDPLAVKASIGVMLEDPHLYERLTGREYLQFIARMYGLSGADADRRTEELINLMDLEDAANKMVVDYSTGMRKKTVLASAMIHDPRVLFLDEPFNGIDPVASKKIKEVMSRLVERGVTIFFSSHVMELVERLCTSVAIIHKGRLHFHAPMSEVRSGGRPLEDIFVDIAGEGSAITEELSWIS